MKERFRNIHFPVFWLVCLSLFLLHQLLQYGLGIHIPVVDSYLDPLLAMPILFGGARIERELVYRIDSNYRISLLEVVIGTAAFAYITEVLFSRWSELFYYDPWDFLMLAVGALLYYLLGRTVRTT